MRAFLHQTGHHAAGHFRHRVLKLWRSRGGGFYGFVAALMFVYLEVVDLGGDLAALPGALRLELGWIISWLVGNFVDAVLNLVWASVWPVTWIDRFGVGLLSAGLLGLAYGAYRLVRPSVLRLLEEPAAAGAPHVQGGAGVEPDTATAAPE